MGQHPGCIGGATGYIDKLILGENHIYHHPTARYIYDSDFFDPEGLFGNVPNSILRTKLIQSSS